MIGNTFQKFSGKRPMTVKGLWTNQGREKIMGKRMTTKQSSDGRIPDGSTGKLTRSQRESCRGYNRTSHPTRS